MRENIPKSVLVPVALLLATHAAGLWQMILLSRTLGVPLWMPYSTLAVLYSLLLVLLVMILRRKRWARDAYAVFGVLGLLSVVAHITDLTAVGWLEAAVKCVALVFLCLPTSSSWFAGSSSDNSFKPKPA